MVPIIHFDSDPDRNPDPHQSDANLWPQVYGPFILSLFASIVSVYGPLWLHFGPSKTLNSVLDVDPDPVSQNDADSRWTGSGSGSAIVVSSHFVRSSQAIELWFTNCLIANPTIMFIICHSHICHFWNGRWSRDLSPFIVNIGTCSCFLDYCNRVRIVWVLTVFLAQYWFFTPFCMLCGLYICNWTIGVMSYFIK